MNVRHVLAVSAIALVGSSAFAAEGDQWKPEASTLTRAEVRAELARAQAAGEVGNLTASYGEFVLHAAAPSRSRVEVRAEAMLNRFNPASLYIGG